MWPIARNTVQQATIDKDFLIRVIDKLPALVAYWDTNLRCRFANQSCYDWFGRPSSEVVGMRKRDLIGAELFRENKIHISQVLKGYRQEFCRNLVTARGQSRKILATYVPDYDGNDVIVGFAVLAVDVTDLERRLAASADRSSSPTGEALS